MFGHELLNYYFIMPSFLEKLGKSTLEFCFPPATILITMLIKSTAIISPSQQIMWHLTARNVTFIDIISYMWSIDLSFILHDCIINQNISIFLKPRSLLNLHFIHTLFTNQAPSSRSCTARHAKSLVRCGTRRSTKGWLQMK